MERKKPYSEIPVEDTNIVPFPGADEEINAQAKPRHHYDSDHPSVRAQNNELIHPIIQTSANTLNTIPGTNIEDLLQDAYTGYEEAIEQLGPIAIENELGIKVGVMFLKAASQLVENIKKESLAINNEPPACPDETEIDLRIAMDRLEPKQRDILETYIYGEGTPESLLRSLAIEHGISTRAVKQHYNAACTAVAKYMGAPTENVHYLPLNDMSDEHPDFE